VPRTAWFYYANKGLWALIMAQMGLATFAGDQLFGLATRIVGTALGLLNGMVVWYIAAPGLKSGNAYAVVVVTVRLSVEERIRIDWLNVVVCWQTNRRCSTRHTSSRGSRPRRRR
jgi:hypothetical protein